MDRDYYARNSNAHKQRVRTGFERIKTQVKDYLESHPCVDCGFTDTRALDFDHVRGQKVVSISVGLYNQGWSWERLMSEIEKCDVRCANCHRIATVERRVISSVGRAAGS